MGFLAALPAIASAGASIASLFGANKKQKEATKQGAVAQRLAKEGDARAREAATSRYAALDPFRTAAQAELARAGTIRPERYAPITGKYTGQLDTALTGATSGLDRMALARQALADYDTQNEPGLANRFRLVGQKAAALGRIGSGLTTTELSDVASQYEKDRLLAGNALMRDATEQGVNDRFRSLDAITGANAGDIALQGANRQFDYGTKRDAVGDRSNAIGQAQSLAGTGYNNGDVINTATDNGTIAALTGGAARNDALAGQLGQSATDAAIAAGRFWAMKNAKTPQPVPIPTSDSAAYG